ncbi:MAG TPA: LEA type 2 family protein [Polyangiaceae bacterium]|jgi:LEA14-like dessication related protein
MQIRVKAQETAEATWHLVALCPTRELSLAVLHGQRSMDSTSAFRTRTWLGVLLVAAALASACAKPKPPTITPKSAQVLAVGATGVTLAVAFDVANPNRFPLIVHAVDGRFLLGAGAGVELGKAHAEPASSIPAQGSSTVISEVAVGWTNLAALTPFLLSPAAVPYRFDGSATLGGDSLNLSLPFVLSGELSRAQLINVGLSGLGQAAGR